MDPKLLFLSFAKDYWDGTTMSRHHIMEGLSGNHKVVFISPQFNIREILSNLKGKRLPKSENNKINKNLISIVPPKIFPLIYKFSWMENLSTTLFCFYIKFLIKDIKYDKLIVYIWNPIFSKFIGKFNEDLVCYHVHDQYKGYATTSVSQAQEIERLEEYVLSKADIVFANGEMLRQSKNLYNSAYNLPSGVDFELYNYVFKNECEIPCEMKEISRPIIGYVGRITRKVDLDLLLQLVAERKGYSFVVIGPVRRDDKVTDKLNLLMQYSNFFYIEEKGAKQLPNYIKFFDVCLMTYVLNEHTKYGYPLKLHEYLAMGKPVVASGLDCFKEFSDFVKVAFLVDEWLKYIDECLVESNNRHLVEKRIKTASQHSWQKRVAKIEKLVIEKLFKEKS